MSPISPARRTPLRTHPGAARGQRPVARQSAPTRPASRSLLAAQAPLIVLSLLGFATISSGSVLLYGLPRLFLFSLGFTALLLMLVRLRLSFSALAFVIAYLGGMAVGSVMAFTEGRLDLPSSIQLLASLGTFVVVATYVEDWLRRGDDAVKLKAIEAVLAFFLVFAIIDIVFYKYIGQFRQIIYDYNIIMSVDRTYNRDVSLYSFPRPVCLFSEASNFSRFIGIILAYHAHVSKFSKRSIGWIALFQIVTRSTSMLFAAPVLAIALYQSISAAPGARAGIRKNRLPIMIGVALAILLVVGGSQIGRFGGGGSSSGGDASAASRLGTPVEYMVYAWDHQFLGSGATAQDQIQEYVLSTEISKGRDYLGAVEGYREGIATTIICIIGMGLLGLIVFTTTAFGLMGRVGLLVVASFLFANFLSAGYNSAAMFVPWAMIYPLLVAPASAGSRSPVPRRKPAYSARTAQPTARMR